MSLKSDNHLTPAAIERMKKEIVRLLKERPAVVEEMQEAATQGDFSENAGYQSAKAALRRLNDRITWLERQLAVAVPIRRDNGGRIGIGSVVTLVSSERTMTYEILGSLESDPSRGRISHNSPLGAALIGKVVHEIVTVNGVKYQIATIA